VTFTLIEFQANAADECVVEVRDAQRVYANRGKKTAVGLSAPTGAGKTVIATSVLERLLFGDADDNPNLNLTVLWLTDDPALNRQTLDKMLLASENFTDGDFLEIDSQFDQKRLEPGKIHFAHIQLFGKGTTSMQPSNDRQFGLWHMVANTVDTYGADFILVRDEAHKGTRSMKGAATIVDRLSHGGGTDHFTGVTHPAAPVIFGISATPEGFKGSLERARRSLESVIVPIGKVRESGLIKDRIIARHPGEVQPAEATLLAEAVKQLRATDADWLEHCRTTGDPLVEPLLVVQVEDGMTNAQMAGYLSAIESEWADLKGDRIAHAFESHATMTVQGGSDERYVRYVSPERIAADNRLRVVFFKKALTTGWDCPRAEVMLSLRVSKDYTTIAQLIGRMVRTPLAERITTNEALNWVTLYLPNYKTSEVAKVISALNEATGDDFDVSVRPVDCPRRPGVPDEVFDALAGLPSAARIKKPWRSQTDRLLGLARLLTGHRLLPGASAKARARLTGAMRTEAAVHADAIEDAVRDVNQLVLISTVWDERVGEFVDPEDAPTILTTRVSDIERQYAAAVRALPDATGKWYWDDLCDEEDADPYEMKARVAALAKTKEMASAFKAAIEKAATDQIEGWRIQFGNQVQMLPAAARREFEAAWNPQAGTLAADIEIPQMVLAPTERITGTGEHAKTTPVPTWTKHIYAAGHNQDIVPEGEFPAVLTGWEVDVLDKERGYDSLTGWYRNPPRSKHGLGIRYKVGSDWGLLYPDFVFFHTVEDELAVDVVDPHRHNEADTGAKWSGLATWAAENRKVVRRVVGVIKVGDHLKALDLTQDDIADRLENCHSKEDIETLFSEKGSAY
jgi:type III restriction enzyme